MPWCAVWTSTLEMIRLRSALLPFRNRCGVRQGSRGRAAANVHALLITVLSAPVIRMPVRS